jgi:uncharacterized protein YdaU (DUF1376 family)
LTPEPQESQDLLSLLRSAQATPDLRRYAAKRLVPLEPLDQIQAVLLVLSDPEPEIAQAAAATLRDIPPDELSRFLEEVSPSSIELDALARHSEDHAVLERLVRHRNVDDVTLEYLARTATGAPQDALIVNQVRLLRSPALIDALFANPALTLDGRRRLNEIREEFFDKEIRRREAEQKRLAEEVAAAQEAADTEAAEGALPAGGTAPAEEEVDPSLAAAYRRITIMTIAEKIDLAYKGNKDERRILIGDSNKLVGLAVLKARGVTLAEIESFCGMRQLDDEIFRRISLNKEWMRNAGVIQAMVRNPGVPLALSLPLVKHIGMRDLRTIARDPNLPEGIRITARKLLVEKRR